jgi:hypothetical protein
MHVQHLREIDDFHLGKGFVAQDAGIGTQEINATPLLGGAIDHCLHLLEVGHIGAIGHCHAARFSDFLDHGFGRRERTAAAVARAAKIVHDDFRAPACEAMRMRAAKTIARAGHDGDASVKPDCHDWLS